MRPHSRSGAGAGGRGEVRRAATAVAALGMQFGNLGTAQYLLFVSRDRSLLGSLRRQFCPRGQWAGRAIGVLLCVARLSGLLLPERERDVLLLALSGIQLGIGQLRSRTSSSASAIRVFNKWTSASGPEPHSGPGALVVKIVTPLPYSSRPPCSPCHAFCFGYLYHGKSAADVAHAGVCVISCHVCGAKTFLASLSPFGRALEMSWC